MIPLYPIKFVWDLLGDTSKAANYHYIQYITISIITISIITISVMYCTKFSSVDIIPSKFLNLMASWILVHLLTLHLRTMFLIDTLLRHLLTIQYCYIDS